MNSLLSLFNQLEITPFDSQKREPASFDDECKKVKEIIFTGTSSCQVSFFLTVLRNRSCFDSIQRSATDILEIHDQIQPILSRERGSVEPFQCAYRFSKLIKIKDLVAYFGYILQEFDALRTNMSSDEIIQSIHALLRIKDSQVLRILLRYNQLYDMPYDECRLKPVEKFNIAIFIELCVDKVDRVSNIYLKKEQLALSRSLVHDVSGQCVYLLLKNHDQMLFREMCTSKKITMAIQIPLDTCHPAVYAVQAVNNTSNVNKMSFIPYASCDRKWYLKIISDVTAKHHNVSQDIEMHKRFSGNKGIWPLLGSVQYTKKLPNGVEIPKVASFTPVASGSLFKIVRDDVSLSLVQFIDIIDQLAHGLDYLHTAGFVHGDINDANALFALYDDEAVEAGFIDFGFCFQPDRRKGGLPYPLHHGYYGSICSTPPELFGDKKFDGDLFNVEIWALGSLLYTIFFRERPVWQPIIAEQWESEVKDVPARMQQLVKRKINETIEDKRAAITANRQRSLSEECTLLIYDMMRLQPELRLNPRTIIQRVTELKKLVS